MNKRRILIVETDADSRAACRRTLETHGYDVKASADAKRARTSGFDLIIRATNENNANGHGKLFHLDATKFVQDDEDKNELRAIIEQTLETKLHAAHGKEMSSGVERIEFELPSDVALMQCVLNFVVARVAAHGIVEPNDAHLFIALDEAFVNAVKHGNKHDTSKLVRFRIDINEREARFTIEDEGEGFDLCDVPDPREPENLFKTSGRGVLLIQNIMDEVKYNACGNRLTMVKRKSQVSSPKSQFSMSSKFQVSDSELPLQSVRDEESFTK
ncbi:MAG: hypothetical protein NVSMB56_08290 [Pyrinomonadaceae bacterium]